MDKIYLKNELKNIFSLFNDEEYYIYKLNEIEEPFDAYYISDGKWKGVAIPVTNEETIEKGFLANFENIKINLQKKQIGDYDSIWLLSLQTKKINFLDNFLLLCMEFLETGEKRQMLVDNPQLWVDKWKELLGNKLEDDMDYSYLGELIVLNYLLEKNANVELTNQGSYDIETEDRNYEVKTSKLKYSTIIEVHSQFQFKTLNKNPLELVYVKIEESMEGISINSIIEEIQNKKYKYLDRLMKKVNDFSTESREKKYKILEIRKYQVNDKFPKIIDSSFKDNTIPKNIINIKYDIDLEGIEYENIKI